MTDRFDDDLGRALRPLGEESLPDDLLDSRLSPSRHPTARSLVAMLVSAAIGLALLIILTTQDRPIAADASPTPAAEPSLTSATASPSAEPEPSSVVGLLPDGVEGEWLYLDGTVDGRSLLMPEFVRVTLTLEAERAFGEGPCNAYGGPIRTDDGALAIAVTEMTEVGCPDIVEVERAYIGALERVVSARAHEAVLHLTGPGIRLRFVLVHDPEMTVEGDWLFVSGVVNGSTLTMPDQGRVTLTVEPTAIRGQAPCNTYGAPLAADGAQFEVGRIMQTLIGCGEVEELESAYIGALGRVTTAELGQGGLWLTGPEVRLRYVRLFETEASLDAPRPLVLPDVVANRPVLPSCGQESVDRQPEGDYLDAEVRACFLAAHDAGEPAEMISDRLTPEGGSYRELIRLLPSGGIEVYADSTQDPLGQRQWTRLTCLSIRNLGTDAAGVPNFIADECDEGVTIVPPDADGQPAGDEVAVLERLIAFARSPAVGSLDDVPLSDDGVWIGLADRLMVMRTAEELADPAAWLLHAEAFRGRVGPFSALEVLGDWDLGQNAPWVREAQAVVGEHPHCVSPPVAAPGEVTDLRRVSLQPVAPASCGTWWSVDLFIGSDGFIQAITLDFYEP